MLTSAAVLSCDYLFGALHRCGYALRIDGARQRQVEQRHARPGAGGCWWLQEKCVGVAGIEQRSGDGHPSHLP
jgi:hypothetical protein